MVFVPANMERLTESFWKFHEKSESNTLQYKDSLEKIIDSPKRNVFIEAMQGSGATYLLIYAMLRTSLRGFNHKILCLTQSQRAAGGLLRETKNWCKTLQIQVENPNAELLVVENIPIDFLPYAATKSGKLWDKYDYVFIDNLNYFERRTKDPIDLHFPEDRVFATSGPAPWACSFFSDEQPWKIVSYGDFLVG
jgi:hypothetical protein